MRCVVEFIGGFLGAGKTNFLNSYLETTYIDEEVIVVIQCEFGKTSISEEFKAYKDIIIKKIDGGGNPSPIVLKRIINFYSPNRIIIECNGVNNPNKLKELFLNDEFLKRNTKIGAYYTIINGALFNNMIRNLGPIMIPHISVANMIIINEWDKVLGELKNYTMKIIEENNSSAYIFQLESSQSFTKFLKRNSLIDKGILKKVIFILKGDRG